MEKSEIKGFIAKRCAKELKDGDVVNLGIGLPTLIPNYLPEGVEVIIHAELGIVSAGKAPKEGDENYDPYHVGDQGGQTDAQIYDVAIFQLFGAALGNKALDLRLFHYFLSPSTM